MKLPMCSCGRQEVEAGSDYCTRCYLDDCERQYNEHLEAEFHAELERQYYEDLNRQGEERSESLHHHSS